MSKQTKIELGTRFGRLVTAAPVHMQKRPDGRMRAHVNVLCDCGNKRVVAVGNLFSANTTSCGCLHKEIVSAQMTTHGMTAGTSQNNRPRLYRIWRGVGQRCNNPKARNFKWYGAKGIKRCAQWDDFQVFYDWSMAHGYADGLELDRVDSDKDYTPNDCRWITKKANLRNRDMCWSDELDAKLVAYAAARNVSPYKIIATAVAEYVGR